MMFTSLWCRDMKLFWLEDKTGEQTLWQPATCCDQHAACGTKTAC